MQKINTKTEQVTQIISTLIKSKWRKQSHMTQIVSKSRRQWNMTKILSKQIKCEWKRPKRNYSDFKHADLSPSENNNQKWLKLQALLIKSKW